MNLADRDGEMTAHIWVLMIISHGRYLTLRGRIGSRSGLRHGAATGGESSRGGG